MIEIFRKRELSKGRRKMINFLIKERKIKFKNKERLRKVINGLIEFRRGEMKRGKGRRKVIYGLIEAFLKRDGSN